MRLFKQCVFTLVLIFGSSTLALAQVDHATLTGAVKDPSGASLPTVAVTATNVSTGEVFTTKSNGEGSYTLSNLPVATYTVAFEAPGFKSFTRKGVDLQVGQRAQVDVKLEIGSVTENVVVTGAPALALQTETGTNLTSEVVTNLPLTANGGRDITAFAFSVTPTISGNTYQTNIGGSQAFTKEVLIDGTSSDSGIVGQVAESEPSMDAVEQFQIDTSGITAAASRTGGGAFLFNLKSGSNSVHGSVYGFLANEFLDANTWTNDYFHSYYRISDPAKAATYRKPKDRYFDYGGSAGGPLWRNRMFIFSAFERYTQAAFGTNDSQATVPATAFLIGDFSALLNTSVAPLGQDAAGNNIYPGAIWDPSTGDVFVGNKIPTSRFSNIAKQIIPFYQKYYAPTSTALVNNYPQLINQTEPYFHQTQFSIKYDWDVTSKNRITSSYIYTLRPRLNDTLGLGTLFQAGSSNGGPLTGSGLQTTVANAYRISDAYTVTPSLLNVLSFTFNQFQNKTLPATSIAGNANYPQQLGLPSVDTLNNFPTINFGNAINGIGETQIGNSYAPGSGYVAYNGILNDGITWTKGKHTIQAGVEVRAIGLNNDAKGGQLHYNFSEKTGTPNNSIIQSQTGFGFANFLLGDVYSASLDTPFNQYGRRKEYALYAEDTIKMTTKLTVDVALRWDIPRPQHEKYGHWSNFTTSARNTSFGSFSGSMEYLSDGSQTFETHNNFLQFGPHAGASYQITPKIVVRGAYGLYYVPIGNNTYGAVPYASTVGYQAVNQAGPPAQQNGFQFNWDKGYPGTASVASRDPNSPYVPYGPASVDPDTLTMGYTQNYNFGVQYEFAKNTKVEVSYIGNIGRKLHDGMLNPLNFPTWDRYSTLYKSGHVYDFVCSASDAANAGVPYYNGYCGEAYQAIAPYPQVASTYGPVYFVNSPLGRSEFNAFVIEVTRRESHGLSMDVSYTLSRAQGNTNTAFIDTYNSSYYRQDPYQYKAASTDLATFDMTHQFKGYVNYELPFGKGKRYLSGNRFVESLAGGWLIGTILNYQSGTPIPAVSSQDYYPGWTQVYANIPAHPNFSNVFKHPNLALNSDPASLFVNPTQFTSPPDGQLGNSPDFYSGWRNWAYLNEDVSVLKNFHVGKGERFPLTLRAEFFDVFNRHHNGSPNLTLGSPYFGHITGVYGNRTGQLGARFQW